MDLAVIIVSWNTRDLTLDTLRTLTADLDAHGPQAEIWVVDSASSDGSAQAVRAEFPQVKLIANDTNLGFAAGNNAALRALGFGDDPAPAKQPHAVYLLNPDTQTQPGATRALYDALFTLPKAGVVGAQLSYADGSFQHGAFMFPGLRQILVDLYPVPGRLHESRFNGRYPRAAYERGVPFPVDHTLGATMMLRREVIVQTGLFDEDYFMYCEEVDWSIRIRRAGWEIYTVPTAHVVHLAGQSTSQVRPQSMVNLWRSRYRLFAKHYPPLMRVVARPLVQLGMARKIAQTRRDENLAAEDRDELIAAYRTIQGMS